MYIYIHTQTHPNAHRQTDGCGLADGEQAVSEGMRSNEIKHKTKGYRSFMVDKVIS